MVTMCVAGGFGERISGKRMSIMDDPRGTGWQKNSAGTADAEKTKRLKEQLEELLHKAAEIEVELSRADGTIKGAPLLSDRGADARTRQATEPLGAAAADK